jgi:hypothetical protein
VVIPPGVAHEHEEVSAIGTVVWIGVPFHAQSLDEGASTAPAASLEVIFELDGETDLLRSAVLDATNVPAGTRVGSRFRLRQEDSSCWLVLCPESASETNDSGCDPRPLGREELS